MIGKGARPRSVTSPFGEKTPQQITAERCAELVVRLKTGDKSVINELTLGHVKLAIYIAGLYANFAPKKCKDLIQESFLGLIMACHKAAEGKLVDDDFTRFAAFRMHRACGNFIFDDSLVRVPRSTKCLNKLKDRKVVNDRELSNKHTLNPLTKIIFDETMSACSDRGQAIVALRLEGYNQEEIAATLNLHRTLVSKEMANVKRRFLK